MYQRLDLHRRFPPCFVFRLPDFVCGIGRCHGSTFITQGYIYPKGTLPAEDGQRALQPLREFGTPLQSEFDVFAPADNLYYWKSINLDALTDDLMALTLQAGLEHLSPESGIVIRPLGGAINRVGAEETAHGDRSLENCARFLIEC